MWVKRRRLKCCIQNPELCDIFTLYLKSDATGRVTTPASGGENGSVYIPSTTYAGLFLSFFACIATYFGHVVEQNNFGNVQS